jgi:hypothetical protein
MRSGALRNTKVFNETAAPKKHRAATIAFEYPSKLRRSHDGTGISTVRNARLFEEMHEGSCGKAVPRKTLPEFGT